MAGEQHVRAADRPGLGVEFLAEDLQGRLGVEVAHVGLGDRKHPAGAAGRVIQGPNGAGPAQHVVILMQQQVHHQPDDLAGGEVLPGGLVAGLREAPDQLLEDVAHGDVGDGGRGDVKVGELSDDGVEQPGLVEPLDVLLEAVLHQHVGGAGREPRDVGAEVGGDVLGVVEQPSEVQRRGVIEGDARYSLQHLGPVVEALALQVGVLREYRRLRRRERGVEPSQDGQRQDHPPILVGLVVPA